jgi:hypothetical protein
MKQALSALSPISDPVSTSVEPYKPSSIPIVANKTAVIQGTADVQGKLTQEEVSNTVDFCLNAFVPVDAAKRDAVLKRVEDFRCCAESQRAFGVPHSRGDAHP